MLEEHLRKIVAEVPDFPKPGISFKDITPALANPQISAEIVESMVEWASPLNPDFIIGIESRGFMLGFALAQKLGIGFIPIRKAGKLPRPVLSESYDLEYGSATIEVHREDIKAAGRVIIHDDLLATGGTAQAALNLCTKAGAKVVGMHFLIELKSLNGRHLLSESPELHSILKY